mmetsp:Transcript_4482/g.12933  ORF Transcript_4482/g.12933 Transcript_4482/m.12933 type:complete len:112 (-) Transcript_4482:221-556(-)
MRSFLLALFCLLSPAAALRAPARAPGALSLASAPPAAVRATASPSMALPSFADAKGLTEEELLQEISNAKKELFMMRKNVKTRQQVKPHLFTHTKHRVSQLQTLLAQRQAA